MSKSLGNGIDPLEVIDKYGADALRMTLITGNSAGNDMRFYWERVEASRNFANKVWNAARFIMMNMEKADISDVDLDDLTQADQWILSKANHLAKEVTDLLDKYEMGVALQKVYDFIWEEFCDWYIEMVKPRLWNEEDETKAAAIWTLKTVLIQSLKLLHPYMPFITEEIFCNLQDEEESIMVSKWPEYKEDMEFRRGRKGRGDDKRGGTRNPYCAYIYECTAEQKGKSICGGGKAGSDEKFLQTVKSSLPCWDMPAKCDSGR